VPCQATPAIPCPTLPCLARPYRTTPATPCLSPTCQASPSRTSPALPCLNMPGPTAPASPRTRASRHRTELPLALACGDYPHTPHIGRNQSPCSSGSGPGKGATHAPWRGQPQQPGGRGNRTVFDTHHTGALRPCATSMRRGCVDGVGCTCRPGPGDGARSKPTMRTRAPSPPLLVT
jgi:hypothetical protein